MAACPAARSFFVRATPRDVNDSVAGVRLPPRDRARALALAAGGRPPGFLPNKKTPPFAGVGFLELIQSVRRRQRRLRHGSTPSLDVLVTRRHWPARWRGRDPGWGLRGAPRTSVAPGARRRCRPPWRSRRAPYGRGPPA